MDQLITLRPSARLNIEYPYQNSTRLYLGQFAIHTSTNQHIFHIHIQANLPTNLLLFRNTQFPSQKCSQFTLPTSKEYPTHFSFFFLNTSFHPSSYQVYINLLTLAVSSIPITMNLVIFYYYPNPPLLRWSRTGGFLAFVRVCLLVCWFVRFPPLGCMIEHFLAGFGIWFLFFCSGGRVADA